MANNYERPLDDFFATPDWCIRGLLDIVDVHGLGLLGYNFFEPCKGSGSIYKYFPDNSGYCCLEEDKDYLKADIGYDPDKIIITNPPFKLALEFLDKSLQEAKVVIYLLRLNFLGSGGRFDFFTKYPPNHAVVLSDRPSFTPDGKTDNCDYAWLIYDEAGVLELKQAFYFIEDPIRAARRAKRKNG